MEVIKKNILLLSTGDTNGAYEYVFRLSKVLIRDGHKVVMLVKNKSKYDDFLIQYNLLPIVLKLSTNTNGITTICFSVFPATT